MGLPICAHGYRLWNMKDGFTRLTLTLPPLVSSPRLVGLSQIPDPYLPRCQDRNNCQVGMQHSLNRSCLNIAS